MNEANLCPKGPLGRHRLVGSSRRQQPQQQLTKWTHGGEYVENEVARVQQREDGDGQQHHRDRLVGEEYQRVEQVMRRVFGHQHGQIVAREGEGRQALVDAQRRHGRIAEQHLLVEAGRAERCHRNDVQQRKHQRRQAQGEQKSVPASGGQESTGKENN